MTQKTTAVRFVHAGDLTTNQAHELVWNEGLMSHRYQELAIVGDRVVGAWQYDIEWRRGDAIIDSSHTGVAPRSRHRGIAQGLWMQGIARWKPTQIKATIGTDEGRDFLARMTARIAYYSPDTRLWVKTRNDDTSWDSLCEYYARQFLTKLGKERAAVAAKKLPKPAQTLSLVAGGSQ